MLSTTTTTTTTTVPSDDVALPSKPPSPEKSKVCINSSSSHWSDEDNGSDNNDSDNNDSDDDSDDSDDSDNDSDDDELTDIEALEWNNYLLSSSGLCECFRLSTSPNNNDVPDSIIIDYINTKLNHGSLSIAVHNFVNGKDTIYCLVDKTYGSDEYIVNGSYIELLKVKKKNIQDLFGIIINDTLSNSFNNENINIELLEQIYNKFIDIERISYVNQFAPKNTPPCYIFPLVSSEMDIYLYGENYNDDPRLKRNDLNTPDFSTAIKCPRLGYNQTDKNSGQKLCCLFCRYKRLQYIKKFPVCTIQEVEINCPLNDTKHFFKKCKTCNNSTDCFFFIWY